MSLLCWADSFNPSFRMASYKGHNYYLALKIKLNFRGRLLDGEWQAEHVHLAEAELLSDEQAIGLKRIDTTVLGEMKSDSRSELLDWVEPGQEWAESVLISPMQRLTQQLGGS